MLMSERAAVKAMDHRLPCVAVINDSTGATNCSLQKYTHVYRDHVVSMISDYQYVSSFPMYVKEEFFLKTPTCVVSIQSIRMHCSSEKAKKFRLACYNVYTLVISIIPISLLYTSI